MAVPDEHKSVPSFESVPDEEVPVPDHPSQDILDNLGTDSTEYKDKLSARNDAIRTNHFVQKKQMILKYNLNPDVLWNRNTEELLASYDRLKSTLSYMREGAELAQSVVDELLPLKNKLDDMDITEDDIHKWVDPAKVDIVKEKIEEYKLIQQRLDDIDTIREEVDKLPDDNKLKQVLLSERKPVRVHAHRQLDDEPVQERPLLELFLATIKSSPEVLDWLMDEITVLFGMDDVMNTITDSEFIVYQYNSMVRTFKNVVIELGIEDDTIQPIEI